LLSDLIPRIYLDFVRRGPPERLVPIFHHNQMDLRGLAALSSRILSLLGDAETQGQDGLELFGVSRICEKRGERSRARRLYEKSIASVLPAETDRAARRSLARLAKREGDFFVACELWKGALGNSRQGYEAYEQLAIYYEHKARDPEHALRIVQKALDELRRANQTGNIAPGPYREIKAKFDHRMTRLERKSAAALGCFRCGFRLKGDCDGGRKKTRVGNHCRDSGGTPSKDHRRSARQPPESTHGVAGGFGGAVGGADHETNRRHLRQFRR
jgi:tetratricopeptide (TPR) repeat protein